MITKDGKYWAAGVVLDWDDYRRRWYGKVEYYDDGFMNDDLDQGRISTEGVLGTRYGVGENHDPWRALEVVVDVLIKDAESLGIQFTSTRDDHRPFLYLRGDGDDPERTPPHGWREAFKKVADRHGWETYPVRTDKSLVRADAP